MMAFIKRFLKITCAVFFGLVALGGMITFVSGLSIKPDFGVLAITVLSAAISSALIRSASKNKRKMVMISKKSKHAKETIQPSQPQAAQLKERAPDLPVQEKAAAPVPISQKDISMNQYRHIPKNVLDLLWFSNGPYKNYEENAAEWNLGFTGWNVRMTGIIAREPSAIDIELPIASEVSPPSPLGYYPSYSELSPEQRTAYLYWLGDITAPIDIGYVFIFYYGLERHLFFGKSESALSEILTLRKFHQNNSFLSYSGDALMLYALLHNRPDIAQKVDTSQASLALRLFSASLMRHSLSVQDMVTAHKMFGFDNNRYIKGEADLFFLTFSELLEKKYGSQVFSIFIEDLRSAKGTFTLALANYSLLPSQRFLSLPDISTSPRVRQSVYELLSETHESVKIKLRELRKKQK